MGKIPTEIGGIRRSAPRRTITKQQAVRHLIHAATRMVAAAEDPFAIHLLVQSADKLLIDVAKRTGKPLAHDWTEIVKPEYRHSLIRVFRETYNYLKHADSDHDESLHVGDIALSNILQLAVCIHNYHSLFGEWTDHMSLFLACAARVVLPDGFVMEPQRAAFDEAIPRVGDTKFGEWFNLDLWREPLLALVGFTKLARERDEDLQDNAELFATRIRDFAVRKKTD